MMASSASVVRVGLLVVALICAGYPQAQGERIHDIKIVEANSISRVPSLTSTASLTLRRQPSNISGPAHLQVLNGQCFKLREGGYLYKVCPFQNVTQQEERIGWNSFHGVLGVWKEWLIEKDTIIGMHYVLGGQCSTGDREVKLLFNCSTVTILHNVSEPSTCHYKLWMNTPLACFKGAMQVYHLLNKEQLAEWEQLDQEYHGDEITIQGLTKRRNLILTKAELLVDREKEREVEERERKRNEQEEEEARKKREEEARKKREEEGVLYGAHVDALFKSPLSVCEEERDAARKELNELMDKVRHVAKEFPDVAFKLGLIQNGSRIDGNPVAGGNEDAVVGGDDDDVIDVDGGDQLELFNDLGLNQNEEEEEMDEEKEEVRVLWEEEEVMKEEVENNVEGERGEENENREKDPMTREHAQKEKERRKEEERREEFEEERILTDFKKIPNKEEEAERDLLKLFDEMNNT